MLHFKLCYSISPSPRHRLKSSIVHLFQSVFFLSLSNIFITAALMSTREKHNICANLSIGFSWLPFSIWYEDFSPGWVILHCMPDIWNAALWGCGSVREQSIVVSASDCPGEAQAANPFLWVVVSVSWVFRDFAQTFSFGHNEVRRGPDLLFPSPPWGNFRLWALCFISHSLHIAVPCIPARLHRCVQWAGSGWSMFTSSYWELEFLHYIWAS